jgi:hypothetical protein
MIVTMRTNVKVAVTNDNIYPNFNSVGVIKPCMLALGSRRKRRLKKKRRNANCAEDTVTDTGSK